MSQRHSIFLATMLLPAAASLILPATAATEVTRRSHTKDKQQVVKSIEARENQYGEIARTIWELAEVGYQEVESSSLLQAELGRAGFEVKPGVAGIPTAFVASSGSGGPVVGILAEFDALPGLSQEAVPERHPREESAPGHGCGHHLFGTASVAAGIAVRDWLESTGTPGTVRVYGTPAEEGGAAKVYMVRAGLFEDVDVALHWHPADRNDASPQTSLANKSAKFRFYGLSTHAAGAPHRGRSALDGIEAMNMMVNLLREHVPQETRIHYVITHGGLAPNVVPDFAEVYYYVRHPLVGTLPGIWDRVVAVSEGAAIGTGTRVEHEVIHGIYNLMPNHTLARLVDANLRALGGFEYTEDENRFAEAIRSTFTDTELALGSQSEIQPFEPRSAGGSTDVGDISWIVPTAGLGTATWVPGTAAHSWQAVAAGGISIGTKGMLLAAKTIAMTAVDIYVTPVIGDEAHAELKERRGSDFVYTPLLGDRDPPLDYRR